MKKIINIIVLLACCFSFAACSDDDDNDNDSGFKPIATENTSLQPLGGDGTITFSDNVASAESNMEWCQIVSVEGNVVSFSVSLSGDVESRNARITVTSVKGEKYMVPINQRGAIFIYEIIGNQHMPLEGGEISFWVKKTDAHFIFTVPEELEYINSGDTLFTVVVPPSDHFRYFDVNFTIGGTRILSFEILQNLIPYSSLLGDWDVTFTDLRDGIEKTYTVNFRQGVEGESFSVYGFPLQLNFPDGIITTMPMEYDPNTGNIMIPPGMTIVDGLSGGVNAYSGILNPIGNTIVANPVPARYTASQSRETDEIYYEFLDRQDIADFVSGGFAFYTSPPAEDGTPTEVQSLLSGYMNPVMRKK